MKCRLTSLLCFAMTRPPTYAEICEVAEEAVQIFSNNGYDCCLFGSTACALYGASRCPNVRELAQTPYRRMIRG